MDATRRKIMRANKGRNTSPEIAVRSMLHAMGYRFRLHRRDLPGSPDIVLPGRRVAIQVHGCFWHQHEGCRRATLPKTRRDYWLPKLMANKARDRDAEHRLADLGWTVQVVWECELAADAAAVRARLKAVLESSRQLSDRKELKVHRGAPQ